MSIGMGVVQQPISSTARPMRSLDPKEYLKPPFMARKKSIMYLGQWHPAIPDHTDEHPELQRYDYVKTHAPTQYKSPA